MALQLHLTDASGNDYPNGYRRFTYLSVDVLAKAIRAEFRDWPDQAARDSGLDPLPRPVVYAVTADSSPSFDEFMKSDNENPSGVGALIYGFAKTRPENADAIDV